MGGQIIKKKKDSSLQDWILSFERSQRKCKIFKKNWKTNYRNLSKKRRGMFNWSVLANN